MSQSYRGYRITHMGTFPMFKIQPPGSGEVPDNLKGFYTTQKFAMKDIDRSLDLLKKRGRKAHAKQPSDSPSTGK